MWTLIQNIFLIELTLERRGSLDQDGSMVTNWQRVKKSFAQLKLISVCMKHWFQRCQVTSNSFLIIFSNYFIGALKVGIIYYLDTLHYFSDFSPLLQTRYFYPGFFLKKEWIILVDANSNCQKSY